MKNKQPSLHFSCFEILAFENLEVIRLIISRKWRWGLLLKIMNYVANSFTYKNRFKSFSLDLGLSIIHNLFKSKIYDIPCKNDNIKFKDQKVKSHGFRSV